MVVEIAFLTGKKRAYLVNSEVPVDLTVFVGVKEENKDFIDTSSEQEYSGA